ncbi:MAG: NUDIX hydrolase [Blautia sp.]|nr:NUDIX hydrolase [Blautia sp.]
MEDKDLIWEEISREHIVQDEWIDFRRSAYRYPDGRVFEPYYSYSRRDYTVIVASDEDGKYLCVRQFRQGIKEVTTEFPAGGIERNDGKEYGSREEAETALACARRELQEETGYTSDEWTHLLTIPSNATIADNYAYVYLAQNCRKISGQHLDETEYLDVKLLTGEEIEALIHQGKFQQSVHVMAWLLAKQEQQKMRSVKLSV